MMGTKVTILDVLVNTLDFSSVRLVPVWSRHDVPPEGCVIAQTVSCRLPTATARVRGQVRS
jgi:hypothetical protein